MKIYYAHHRWKYGTEIEAWEISLIRERFPEGEIVNPSDVIEQNRPEESIMTDCLRKVAECDVLVFSSLTGVIGEGVTREIELARHLGREVYYLHHGRVEPAELVIQPLNNGNDRTHAAVWLP